MKAAGPSDRFGAATLRRPVPPPLLATLVALVVATLAGVYASAEGRRASAVQADGATGELIAAARLEVPAADATTIRMVTVTLAPLATLVGEPQPGPLLVLVANGELAVRRDDGNAPRSTVLSTGDQLALPSGTAVRVSGSGNQPVTFSVVALLPAARDQAGATMVPLTAGPIGAGRAVDGEPAQAAPGRPGTIAEDE